ncbi:MAG TPA: class I SAM-dependent methyltransferase [Candidatus Binatia bacterium]|nr:class I SAM-dependent methyltransferase [Candidatus Binatia bacterium]
MRRTWPTLPVAGVLGCLLWSGCTSLKRFAYQGWGRDAWQRPAEVIAALAIQPGAIVADLGAGGGYFTFRLAEAVGPAGTVYAVDIDADLLEYIADRARTEGLSNVRTITAGADDPRLPSDGVDLLFTSNVYHHLENRSAYFANVRKALRPGGRVAIVEHAGKSWFSKWFGHNTPSQTIRNEMAAAGYRLDQEFTFLSQQHFLVFSPAS